ncbi:CHD3-type chromatin-remodeling factor PICKLE [Sesbania bispinosa]|nr:CHD3-type chromatin-remodeling factor PICKLE [Sesbania bispinosa]
MARSRPDATPGSSSVPPSETGMLWFPLLLRFPLCGVLMLCSAIPSQERPIWSWVLLFFVPVLLPRNFPGLQLVLSANSFSPMVGQNRRSEHLTMLVQRWSCKTHTFLTSWEDFSPTLEDVVVLLKLPMFGDFDLSTTILVHHIAEMSKALKSTTAESARHTLKKLALRRAHQTDIGSPSSVKMCLPKRKRVPKLLLEENVFPEYRVQGWSLGRPRHPLVDLIDDENYFVFCPYTSSFSPGVEGMDRIYLEPSFSTRNSKGSRLKGVYDFWLLCVRPRVLPGFIVSDTVGLIGGVLFPFLYRPDRVCRQFGLDQPHVPLDLEPLSLQDAMRVGRLKASVAFFEGIKSTSPSHEILIVYKDPYYTTSVTVDEDKSAKLCATAPSIRKVSKRTPPVSKRPFAHATAPRRSSERLKARPTQGLLYCFSSSSGDFLGSDQEDSSDSIDKSRDASLLSNPPCSDSTQNTSMLRASVMAGLGAALCSQLFMEEDAKLLSEFSGRHVKFLLSEAYPQSYQRLAYQQFLGEWFDELIRSFNRSIPPSAFEDLNKISESIKAL